MKKRDKKKTTGFTLVELLVAITILGIILVIAIPQVINLQSDNKTTKYQKYSEALKTAGKLYTDSYAKDMFGANASGCYDIPYSVLKEKNLAKDIKVDGANCNTYAADGKTPQTYVKVLKSNDNYSYQIAIKCVNESGGVLYEKTIPGAGICDGTHADEDGPGIVITPDGHDWYNGKKSGVADKVTIKISDQYGLLENTSIEYAWLKDGEAESSLTYTKKDFKNKRGDGKLGTPITETVEVPQGVTGEYTLVIKADKVRDANGLYMSVPIVRSKKFKLDNTKPTIPTKTNSKDGVWTNQNVVITAKATDAHSGVAKIYYTYTNSNAAAGLKEDWTTKSPSGKDLSVSGTWSAERNSNVYLIAEDKAGNQSAIVPVGKIMIDKTNPTVTETTNSSNGAWTNQNVTITAKATDASSGIKKIYYTYASNASATKYSDWTTNNTTSVSGVWSAERDNTVYIIAEDNAGNFSAFKSAGAVRIDKTPPTIPTGGAIGAVSGSTAATSIKTAASGSSDVLSGVKQYLYVVKTAAGTPANTDSGFKASLSYTRACGQTNYAYAIAVDNAGNRSQVKSLGTSSDGANSYSNWSACSKACGSGTQTRTNSCALVTTGFSQACNTQDCCSSYDVTWGAYGSCSKACGSGTQTRTGTKYSKYDGRNCGTTTSSQACNTQTCCSSTTTTWGSWGSCSVTCGSGTKSRTGTKYSIYDNSNCGTTSETTTCDTGKSCGPPAHTHATGALGTTLKPCNWTLSCGTYHPKGYYGYCGKCWNYGVIYKSTTSKYCPGRNIDGCKNWGTVYPTVVPD